MSKTRNEEVKFDEERINRLVRYAKHELLRSPYTDKYTENEIEEAKRRFELTKKMEPTPSILDSFFGFFSTPTKPAVTKPKEPAPPSGCILS